MDPQALEEAARVAQRATDRAALSRVPMPEAGGACHVAWQPAEKLGPVSGSPALCDQLLGFLDR